MSAHNYKNLTLGRYAKKVQWSKETFSIIGTSRNECPHIEDSRLISIVLQKQQNNN